MPVNLNWLEIKASDADPSRWPKNMTPVPDEEGNVSFFHPVSVQDLAARKWREVIGQALAAMMKYPSTGSKRT